jgi:anti-sigma factor RsiW
MTCAATREWILEVNPEELGRYATGEHADHLTACPECRALADEILGADVALRDTLASVEPALGVEAALVRAREGASAQKATRRRRSWQVAVPLAAAALGGILLMNRPAPAPVPAFDPATMRAARALGLVGTRPVVNAQGHQSVAVLPTENPNITVIWFME